MKKVNSGYIVSESADFWLTGGISICVMSIVLVYVAVIGIEDSGLAISSILGSAMVLQVLLNWPHFMGSYSVLYSPRENIKKYKSATIYIPLALAAVIGYSIEFPIERAWYNVTFDTKIAYSLWLIAAFYLAWHYTGQAWGMMAVFAKLSGLTFTSFERLVFRYSLRALLVWHVIWGAQDLPDEWFGGYLSRNIDILLNTANLIALAAFALSAYTMLGIKKRVGQWPDKRIVASWLSIFLWYFVLYFVPEAFMLVQASHALQYLAFPFRVELNRAGGYLKKNKKKAVINSDFPLLFWTGKYYLILVTLGLLVFYAPEIIFSESNGIGLAFMIASAISIHHYFVDSCIWHIRNQQVKNMLFQHLPKGK